MPVPAAASPPITCSPAFIRARASHAASWGSPRAASCVPSWGPDGPAALVPPACTHPVLLLILTSRSVMTRPQYYICHRSRDRELAPTGRILRTLSPRDTWFGSPWGEANVRRVLRRRVEKLLWGATSSPFIWRVAAACNRWLHLVLDKSRYRYLKLTYSCSDGVATPTAACVAN